MPQAKRSESQGLFATRTAAERLGLSVYVLKARIAEGRFPEPTRVTESGVALFDEAWLDSTRAVLTSGEPAVRRRGRRPGTVPSVPTPERVLGYRPGTARRLPDWGEIVGYFQQLSAATDRVVVEELGPSTLGNPYIVVAVSDAANLIGPARERNRSLLGRLWDSREVAETDIDEAIRTARTVPLIMATQHSSEIGAALMTMELAYELATKEDAETREIRANTVTLLIPSANPDGIEIITEWYRRWLGTPYEGCDLPWLYHPYVGHDNNRDWFMLTQPENRLYAALHNREHPQLVFDMHQMSRDGARFMVPPFIDPLDPNQDPVIQQGFAALGSAIAARLTAAGKAGVATHIIFDNYSPSLAYGNYHGSIDLLSEAASCRLATPVTVEEDDLRVDRAFDPRARTWNHPLPWTGGEWTLADIVEYDRLAARAFLEHAAKYREQILRDYRGIQARTLDRPDTAYGYVIPDNQHDPVAAVELLQTLERGAVEIEEATAPIVADGVTYPEGTRVVRLGQPAGSFAKTLLEIQKYPDLRQWPDGPPKPPYDIAGHTLSIQLGVRAVEVKTPIRAAGADAADEDQAPPLRRVAEVTIPSGTVSGDGTFGWGLRPAPNRSTLAIQRLLAGGNRVHRAVNRVPGLGLPPGSVLVPRAPEVDAVMRDLAASEGLDVVGLDGALSADTHEVAPVRLGIYQSWRPSIDEGWARWVCEEYEIPSETLHNADIRQGDLASRFDAILLPHQEMEDLLDGNTEKNRFKEPYPPEYTGGLGDVGIDALKSFVEAGGTLIAIDAACEAIVKRFALPVRNVLEGIEETDFYCPGSLLRVVMDSNHPLAWGLPRETAVLFMKSAAWEVGAGAGDDVTVVGRYPTSDPNLSGWILGEQHLFGKAALVEVALGEGRVVLIGFRPQFRAQARGTYKVLFNAILRGASRPARLELG